MVLPAAVAGVCQSPHNVTGLLSGDDMQLFDQDTEGISGNTSALL